MNNHKLILICALSLGLSMQSPAAAFWPTCPNFIHRIREVAIKHAAPAQNAIKNAVTHVVTNFPRLAKNAAIGLGIAGAVYACFGVYGIIRMRPLQEALTRSKLLASNLTARNTTLEDEKAAAAVENTKLKQQNTALSSLAQDSSKKLEQVEQYMSKRGQDILAILNKAQAFRTELEQVKANTQQKLADYKDDLVKIRSFFNIPDHR